MKSLLDFTSELFGNQYSALVLIGVLIPDETILNIRPISDRLIDRNRPRRRCPDHRMRAAQLRNRAFNNLKRHINLRRDNILILNLGFGQGGFFNRRPHHGLGPAIELAAFGELQ